ncbi:helix-turn-helix domain-containing protein [Paenibacillus senegalensis]|uniref:helix-turn-helix domain-containing protein n=1 Tax=Paenibacillus senegalensis TaxID=1465766 RepID=UPI000287D26E|nr:helix-turn-helix domain-containing protein [Paenibacillus senegalensis]
MHLSPAAALSDFINVFWLQQGCSPAHGMGRVLPDGTMELVINLEEDLIKVYDQTNHDRFERFRGSLISGPHSKFTVIDTACQVSAIGVHFKPGGAFPFLKAAANELRNVHLPLDILWGTTASEMRDQLFEAETPAAKFRILEYYLMGMMTGDSAYHPAVFFALKKFQATPYYLKIADVTEQITLSSRRFIQVFKEQVGLSPKQFLRIQRFQHVLQQLKGREQVNWAELALICGYYDQAHFIHDFQAFSGISPKTYRLHQSTQHNHVPLGQ